MTRVYYINSFIGLTCSVIFVNDRTENPLISFCFASVLDGVDNDIAHLPIIQFVIFIDKNKSNKLNERVNKFHHELFKDLWFCINFIAL